MGESEEKPTSDERGDVFCSANVCEAIADAAINRATAIRIALKEDSLVIGRTKFIFLLIHLFPRVMRQFASVVFQFEFFVHLSAFAALLLYSPNPQ